MKNIQPKQDCKHSLKNITHLMDMLCMCGGVNGMSFAESCCGGHQSGLCPIRTTADTLTAYSKISVVNVLKDTGSGLLTNTET